MLGVTLGTPADYKRLVADYRRIIKHCDPVGKVVNNQVNAASWLYCGRYNVSRQVETAQHEPDRGTPPRLW